MDSRLLSGKTLKFGLFELDVETQQLRKAGVPLRIQPQPFKVLTVLATSGGRIVPREELRRELWGTETFVDFEQGLNYCIRQIRAVLGEEAQSPHYIETVPRKGYRFIATVESLGGTPNDPDEFRVKPGFWSRRRIIFTFAAFLVTLTAVTAAVRSRRRSALTTKDYLLITEFSNQTGDPVFDGTLRRAASIDLSQSPYLNIIPDDKIRQTLKLMGKSPDTPVSPEIGREICRRNGVKAMLTGSVEPVGTQYLLTVDVISAGSGDMLAEERVQAKGKDEILGALDTSNQRLREKLGESLATIQQFDKPLAQATTSSLQALQLYTLGLEKRESEGELAAIPYLERALQIDPDFALAHAYLGTAYMNVEQLQLSEDHEKQAMALIDRVSEREKLYITAHYYLLIGQREKASETYETYGRFYPQDQVPHANLANEYSILGRYDKALEHSLLGLRLNPDSVGLLEAAGSAYAALGRFDEAREAVANGLRLSPDNTGLHLLLSNIALAQGDAASRSREDAALRTTPGGTLNLLYRDAALAASRGHLHDSEELYSEASQLALKLNLKDNASFALGLRAVYEAYVGKPLQAKESAKAALKLSHISDTIEPAAVALAVAGEEQQSLALIDDLGKRRPEDTSVQFVWVPMIHAIGKMHQGDFEGAIHLVSGGVPYDRGNLDSMLCRANALLQAKHAAEALEEFRRVVDLRNGFPADPAGALAILGLARAHVALGDTNSARSRYRDFMALWTNADSTLPVFKQAKDESSALQ